MPPSPPIIRPAPALVRLTAAAAIFAALALPLASLMLPALAFTGIVILLAALDWSISRKDPAPIVERILPPRLVRERPASATYRLRRSGETSTRVDILDELPSALGGDLLLSGIQLDPDQRHNVSREILPTRRGTFAVGQTLILWRSHMGLLRLRSAVSGQSTAVILPSAASPQRRAGLEHRSLREDLGIKPRPLRGEGTEFESLREYVLGDDPRHIDWRASARHPHLQVRQYQTERRHTVVVALDTGRLMGAHVNAISKLDHAINCAAALARASIGYGDRVGLLAFDRQLRVFERARAGKAGVAALIDATSALAPMPFEPDFGILVETLARHQKKRSLVVVLTDFVEGGASRELEDYLGVLARRHCVMLVALRDPILREADEREPSITRERLYRRLALQDLVAEREAALSRIARFGAQVLDLDPELITAPVLNRYLAVRDAALI